MRILESWHIPYQAHHYEAKGPVDGVTVCRASRQPCAEGFTKRWLPMMKKGNAMCSSSPAISELDLKKGSSIGWCKIRIHAGCEGIYSGLQDISVAAVPQSV